MKLRTAHLVLIASAEVLAALLVPLYSLAMWRRTHLASWALLAAAGLALGGGLEAYRRWFLKKKVV